MSDANLVIELIEAFRRSKCMFTAAALGVFDATPATRDDLAERFHANPDALERLLQGCVSLGLLARDGSTYRNTEEADTYLRRTSEHTLVGYVLYSDSALYQMWGHLDDAVKEGTHRWKQAFGLEGGALFTHFFRTPEAQHDFLLGMHGFGQLASPTIARAFDLSPYTRFVDLGGATGHLAMAAADAWPSIEAAVFDLPQVVETARQFTQGKVDLIPGDFFTDPLPPADIYALGRILHDWSEPKIVTLLRKIHAALPDHGALLIAEKLLLPDRSGPVSALMQSLNMLICTEGKERTLAEYEELLRDAGFRSVEGVHTGKPVDAVLARK